MRVRPCTVEVRRGRLRKAQQFYDAAVMTAELAGDDDDVGDAYVTLCVHAGIAAADVICCVALGQHAVGESHNEAVALLASADKSLSGHLRTLLNLKTSSGYGHTPTTDADQKRAGRSASALMAAARMAITR